MKRLVLTVLVLVAASVVGAPAPFPKTEQADRKTDLAKMQGEWAMVAGGSERVVIAGGRIRWCLHKDTFTEAIYLDPAKNPKEIDFVRSDYHRTYGIYRLDGDTLTVCVNNRGQLPRPSCFYEKTADDAAFILRRKR